MTVEHGLLTDSYSSSSSGSGGGGGGGSSISSVSGNDIYNVVR